MGWWLIGKPRWVRGLLLGLIFGAMLGTYFGIEHGVLTGVISGVLGGVFYGVLMTLLTGSTQDNLIASAGPLGGDDLEAAVRAVRHGPDAATSPEAIHDARRMVEYSLAKPARQRRTTVAAFIVGSVLLVAATLET